MNGENPNATNRNSILYGLHGGELPGSGADLGIVKILERPESPSELETGRAPKNGRSDFGLTIAMKAEDTKIDGLVSGAAKSAALTGEATDGKTVMYATMLAKSSHEDVCSKRILNFTDEEVVVLDEDCLVDEPDAFLTIIFSDHVHDQIDKSSNEIRENLSSVGPRLEVDGSLTECYGPWMVATGQRRHYIAPNIVDKDMFVASGLKSGFCFVALATTEDGAGLEQTMKAEHDVKKAEENDGTRVEAKTIARGK
ncbi:hypothetical protein V6N11_071737 [Hibiscus sabdariffa]|uniref:Uncharacterized protein n=1 Tax=Hibiscus sabdariffa TaxID=183260 RepID=A0ABR2U0Z8_9ROSI